MDTADRITATLVIRDTQDIISLTAGMASAIGVIVIITTGTIMAGFAGTMVIVDSGHLEASGIIRVTETVSDTKTTTDSTDTMAIGVMATNATTDGEIVNPGILAIGDGNCCCKGEKTT